MTTTCCDETSRPLKEEIRQLQKENDIFQTDWYHKDSEYAELVADNDKLCGDNEQLTRLASVVRGIDELIKDCKTPTTAELGMISMALNEIDTGKQSEVWRLRVNEHDENAKLREENERLHEQIKNEPTWMVQARKLLERAEFDLRYSSAPTAKAIRAFLDGEKTAPQNQGH